MKSIKCATFLFFCFFSACVSADSWDWLLNQNSYDIGVRDIHKLNGKDGKPTRAMFVSILEGFKPNGRDLGYPKLAGSRLINVGFECNDKKVVIFQEAILDLNGEILENLPNNDSKVILRNSDPAIERSVNYACGDKTAKISKSTAKDLVFLVCRFNTKKENIVEFEVNYSDQTVNNVPARIDSKTIVFPTKNGENLVKINRVTGLISLEGEKDGFVLTGNCIQQSGQKF